MPDTKLSALPAADSLGGSDLCYVAHSGASNRATLAQVAAYCAAAILPPQVQCSGDSITRGDGLSDPPVQSYPGLIAVALGSGWNVTNEGQGGATVGTVPNPLNSLITRDPALIGPFWSGQRPINIFSAFGGTNDLYYNEDPAALQTDYPAWCRAMRTLGYKVIAWTILSRTLPESHEANRAAFNGWLRAHYGEFADDLCDAAAIPELGAPGASTNTTYFQDGTHPTAAGQALIAPLIKATVLRLAAGAPVLTGPAVRVGTMGLQSLSANNCWIADNLYFDGAAWRYADDGDGVVAYFAGGGWEVQTAPNNTGGAGAAASLTTAIRVDTGGITLPTLPDAAAPVGGLYLGSDHPDNNGDPQLCRKTSSGVTVIG